MRNIYLIVYFTLFCISTVYAQYGSAPPGSDWTPYVLNLNAQRWTDWSNAGRQGGIPSNFAYYVNINDIKYSGTFTQKLIEAIADAHNFGVEHNVIVAVKIPAGNFTVTTTINILSNVVIKGAGSNQTQITFQTGNPADHCFKIKGSYDTYIYKEILNGSTMGSVSITVNDASNLYPDDFIDIRDSRKIEFESSGPISYSIGQVVQIASKSGNQLILKDKLSLNHSGFAPRVYKITPVQNVGLEDLHINRSLTDGAGNGATILFRNAANCWVKGCELSNTSSMHIKVETSTHITIKGNFIHHAQDYGDGGRGYGVALYYRSTNCLIEDNLLNFLRHALIVGSSVNRNVISYNYCWDRHATGTFLGIMEAIGDISIHGNYAHRNLFEGNSVENIFADDWFGYRHGYSNTLLTGNGPYNTFLRNYIRVEQISLHACDYATVIGSNAIVDDEQWYIPLVLNYRGSVGTVDYYSEYVQDCNNQTLVTWAVWVMDQAYIENNDFFPDISYYLTGQKMQDLFSTTVYPNYNGAVYGSTYGWFNPINCNYSWFEPRNSPAEYRMGQLKKTLDGGTIGQNNINAPIVTNIKQIDSGNNIFGQASYWHNNIWENTAPTQQVTLDYQRQHFLALQNFKPGSYEKFNYWQELPNNGIRYRNWDTLSLQQNTVEVKAQFKPTANVTVKNILENQSNLTDNVTDYIQVKDPWLVDIN